MYVIHEPSELSFERAGVKGKVFPTQERFAGAEFVLVATETGHETQISEKESTLIYYVIEGSGQFLIEGDIDEVTAGDMVIVPLEKVFTYKGKLKMLRVSVPPWREDQEETAQLGEEVS